jgi:hypothetical protein
MIKITTKNLRFWLRPPSSVKIFTLLTIASKEKSLISPPSNLFTYFKLAKWNETEMWYNIIWFHARTQVCWVVFVIWCLLVRLTRIRSICVDLSICIILFGLTYNFVSIYWIRFFVSGGAMLFLLGSYVCKKK